MTPKEYTNTSDEIKKLLEHFEVLDIQHDHIFPFVVEKYIKYEYEIVPWFAAMPKKMFEALEKKLVYEVQQSIFFSPLHRNILWFLFFEWSV